MINERFESSNSAAGCRFRCAVSGVACLVVFALNTSAQDSADIGVSPGEWKAAELTRYVTLNNAWRTEKSLAQSDRAMVAGATQALAVHAGLKSLQAGGDAVDAALTTAITQIALSGGCYVSFAGVLAMVYYDDESGEVYSLNAGFNVPAAEDTGRNIPGPSTVSGRSILVPGFMAGVGAAHERFGKLPFETLFDPAMFFATEGISVDWQLARFVRNRKEVLARFDATRNLFLNEEGNFIEEGDTFRQPELAKTLRRVATQGPDYMYTGKWGRRFVKRAREIGGRITYADMERYRAIWTEPIRSNYRDYEIITHGLPSFGGVDTVEGLNLLELSGAKRYGHYTRSAESLFWTMQASNAQVLSYIPPWQLRVLFRDQDLSLSSRTKKSTSAWIWERMRSGNWPYSYEFEGTPPEHSDSVVVVDRSGNIAVITHTIYTAGWGTGLVVDGVSISDVGAHQQERIQRAGAGNRFPDELSALLVRVDGEPILACSTMGSGVRFKLLQVLSSILDFEMDPKAANDLPAYLLPEWSDARPIHRVIAGEFDASLLEEVRAMGQPVQELAANDPAVSPGYWTGVQRDPQTNKLRGSVPNNFNGLAEGF